MSNEEVETVARRAAQILKEGDNSQFDGMACVAGPPRQVINEKLVDGVVQRCQEHIFSELHSDDEQFLAVAKLRERMSDYWDEQLRQSNEVSSVNQNRASVLGKFIDMTIPR